MSPGWAPWTRQPVNNKGILFPVDRETPPISESHSEVTLAEPSHVMKRLCASLCTQVLKPDSDHFQYLGTARK